MANWSVERDLFARRLVYKTTPITLSFGAGETEKSISLFGNCLIHTIKVLIANWTNPVTLTLTVVDPDGDTIYTSDALAPDTFNAITGLKDLIAIWGTCTLVFTLSGAPGGSGGDVVSSVYCI